MKILVWERLIFKHQGVKFEMFWDMAVFLNVNVSLVQVLIECCMYLAKGCLEEKDVKILSKSS